MKLYLLRHGIAVNLGKKGCETDDKRILTDKGRKTARKIAGSLLKLKCTPKLILTSPLIRCVDTALIISKKLSSKTRLEECKLLAPGMSLDGTVQMLQQRKEKSIMLVGHSPDLSILASILISGKTHSAITLKKAGICNIIFADKIKAGSGQMEWLLTPEQLLLF